MDFVLGILTGIVSMLFLGVYLNERDKKRKSGVPKHRNPPHPPTVDGEVATATAMYAAANAIMSSYLHVKLQADLDAALEREDYAEAARLRDLINRK